MTLAQKRMAAMVMEILLMMSRLTVPAKRQQKLRRAVAVGSAGVDSDEDGAMEQSDDEDEASQERKKREEQEKAREIEQAKALQANTC